VEEEDEEEKVAEMLATNATTENEWMKGGSSL